jgi:predicted NAD/FAD-binding protein
MPDEDEISTSYVERNNLNIRMGLRRFTRLTNAFSKKAENHEAAIALWLAWYNFGRIHKTLRVTPAMAAGVSSTVWDMPELIERALAA